MHKQRSMKKTVRVAVWLALALGAAGCGKGAPDIRRAAAVQTKTESVQDGDAMRMVCRGQAEPARSYSYRLAGGQKIFRYLVREGEQVRAGQPLFASGSLELLSQSDELHRLRLAIWDRRQRLDDLDWRIAELEQAFAAMRADRDARSGADAGSADLASMAAAKKRELERMKEEKRILSAIAEEDRQLGRSLDELDARIGKDIDDLFFRAPFAGRVISVAENPEQLLPGEAAIELWDESQIAVRFTVWQNQLRFIAAGQVVEVQPDLFEGVQLKGTVLTVGQNPERRVNNDNPEYAVRVLLQDERGLVRPGMSVSVCIDLAAALEP
jgi:multidrug efflux pump subunit AcrA (membrane-fusion protein)